MFRYFLYQIALFFLNYFPISLCYRLAKCVSDYQYQFSKKDRMAVQNNLKQILPPEADLAYHTKEVFHNFGRYLVEFFTMGRLLSESNFSKNIKVEGLEHLKTSLKRGKGGIILTGHLGNWELGAGVLSSLGYSISVVALEHESKPVNDLFNRQRAVKGVSVIPVQKAKRECLEVLKKKQLVAIVADRDFNLRGEEMDFLGKKSIVPRGAAAFSVKTGAPIIPVFLMRNKDFSFTLFIEEPLYAEDFSRGKDEKEGILNMVKVYLKIIEEKIYQYPSQWLIFREFWLS